MLKVTGLLLLPMAFPLPIVGRMMIPPLPYSSSSGQENDSELKVEIFYEALCPDSKNFFVDTLEPVLSQFNQFISITLVPYGKAKLTKATSVVLDYQTMPNVQLKLLTHVTICLMKQGLWRWGRILI